ncbi:MAG: hypothetical protein L0216_12905 [Planctomycetales bacterium]|nr:hypothetical protein [Planctomycetales bacterium]
MSRSRECTAAEYADYLRLFTNADPEWGTQLPEGEAGGTPLLLLPSEVFRWDERLAYGLDTDAKVERGSGRPLLFLRVLSWDPVARARAEPGSLDFCIPIAHDGAGERERLSWTLFAGAWSDTRDEAILVLEEPWREWVSGVQDRIVVGERGRKTGSLATVGEREREGLGAFIEACVDLD